MTEVRCECCERRIVQHRDNVWQWLCRQHHRATTAAPAALASAR